MTVPSEDICLIFQLMLHSQKLMESPQMRKTILNEGVIRAAGMVMLMLSSQQRKLKVDRYMMQDIKTKKVSRR